VAFPSRKPPFNTAFAIINIMVAKKGKQPVLNKPFAVGKQKCVTKIKAKRILNFYSMT
jgi:hypothetical protein